jgi:small subunit ribosomal protein S1
MSIMQELLEKSFLSNFKAGGLIQGTVTEIRPSEVLVDIGAKSEGVIPISEFAHTEDLHVGMQVEVILEKLENRMGNPVLSFDKAEQKKNWELVINKYQEGSIVQGRVKSKVKGGLVVQIGVEAFLPASQIDVQAPKNLEQYIGQTYNFKIVRIDRKRCNIVLSRRELIESEREEKRRVLLEELKVGDTRRGVVKNITDYGAFVDLDGVDGLLHITDLSWGRISHPSEVVKVGEELNVKVIGIDTQSRRVSLGLKQTVANPWDGISERYEGGKLVKGKVVNMVNFGLFVMLEPGVEALVHISELSWTKRVNKPSELFTIGQEVEAIVLATNKDKQEISLSIRQALPNPWEMIRHDYPVGARVRGKVSQFNPFGATIELANDLTGFIHVSDMSWTRKVKHPSEVLKLGEEIDTMVVQIDPDNQQVVLSLKQLQDDPWQNIEAVYRVGEQVEGTVTKLTSYGAFIKLANDIDGLMHISHVSADIDPNDPKAKDKMKASLKIGQKVSPWVVKIDNKERRIGLSMTAGGDPERLQKETEFYKQIKSGQELSSLGDILDQATAGR